MSANPLKAISLITCTLCAAANPSITLAASADIHNLGTLGGTSSFGADVNGAGRVVGTSNYTTNDLMSHAFLYTGTPGSGGVMHDLGTLGGARSVANAVNASGQVTGSSYFPDEVTQHAFIYTGTPGVDGIMHDLGPITEGSYGFNDSYGLDINNSGQATGFGHIGDARLHAFRFSGGMQHLGTLGDGAQDSRGHAINDAGQVVGYSHLTNSLAVHAFRYDGTPGSGGVMRDLGTLGGTNSSASDINASGQVTGGSQMTGDATSHAYRYTGTPGSGGAMADLGTLGGTTSAGLAINDLGQVAGFSFIEGDAVQHAFLYTGTPGAGGLMIDLDAWLDANNPAEGAKWTLNAVSGLTNAGLVAGEGVYNDGPGGLSDGIRAFRLDASGALVPEPVGLPLLAIAALALTPRRRAALRRIDEDLTKEKQATNQY